MKKFIDKYLLLSAGDYVDGWGDFNINLFLLAITAGFCIAAFIISYRKRHTAIMLRQLFRHNATSEEAAKTLTELRLNGNKGLMRALRSDSGDLKKMVKRVGEKVYTYEEFVALQKKKLPTEEDIDFSSARFYLNEETTSRAKRIYETETPSYIRTTLLCVFMVAVFFIICFSMPEILSAINSIISK